MGRPKKDKPTHSSSMYVYKATIGHDFDGSPIRKAFYSKTSKEDAKAKANQYIIDKEVSERTGKQFVSKDESFEHWSKIVLKNLKGTIKDNSYNLTYKNSIEKHLIPYFGKRNLIDIKQIDIQNYFNKKSKELSIESLKKHKMALNRIFDYAVINDLCIKNPVTMIKMTSIKKPEEKQTYTKEQCILVLDYSKTHRFGVGINLMLEYGISRSELLGLMWDDIDEENKLMFIDGRSLMISLK